MPTAAPATRRRRFGHAQVSVRPSDGMRWWTSVSVAGFGVAMVLALVGGFPVDVPMPTHSFGWVEPSCGLTRGSTALVRGDLALAWRYNPLSYLVVLFGVSGVARWVAGRSSARWVHVSVRLRPLGWSVLAVLVIAFTLYQQSNAEFIINARA